MININHPCINCKFKSDKIYCRMGLEMRTKQKICKYKQINNDSLEIYKYTDTPLELIEAIEELKLYI